MELKDSEGPDLTSLVLGMFSPALFFSAVPCVMVPDEFARVSIDAALLMEDGDRRRDFRVVLGGVSRGLGRVPERATVAGVSFDAESEFLRWLFRKEALEIER